MKQRPSMALMFTLPALAVAWVTALWFVGKSSSGQLAGRLWIPAWGADELWVRSAVATAADARAPEGPVELELRVTGARGTEIRLIGRSDAEGRADWRVALAGLRPSRVQLYRAGDDVALVEATLEASSDVPALEVVHRPLRVTLNPSGVPVDLALGRGALSLPLEDQLRVQWPPGGGATLGLELSGASTDGGERQVLVQRAEPITLRPTDHVVEVTLRDVPAQGEPSVAFALLPVVPGAIGVVRNGPTVRLVSPVPRPEAYWAYATRERVLSLGRLALARHQGPEGDVTFEASELMPAPVRAALEEQLVWLVTSSEWDLMSEAQLAWPLNAGAGEATTAKLRWRVQGDGAPSVRHRVQEHRRVWRLVAWSGITLLCGVELLLVTLYGRRENARLAATEVQTTAGRLPWLALISVALGFGGLAALFAFW